MIKFITNMLTLLLILGIMYVTIGVIVYKTYGCVVNKQRWELYIPIRTQFCWLSEEIGDE